MRQWQILFHSMCAAGGGPMPVAAFDNAPSPHTRSSSLTRMLGYGFVEHLARGHGGIVDRGRWAVTPLGWDYFFGRVKVITPHRPGINTNGRPRGAVNIPVATWLRALPRTNEIRLTS